jgi:hypothetical protein
MKSPLTDQSKMLLVQLFYQTALIIFYALFFGRLFPDALGAIGPDYQYFFPHLLDGCFWFRENGVLTIPWFSPAFCGGLPAWANPQNIFYSVPQFFTLLLGPLQGVYLSVIVFVWLGYIGMYLLMRRVFQIRRMMATLAATLFSLNGFYFSHMAIGHLAFQPFMLTPLLCFFLLKPLPESKSRLQTVYTFIFYAATGGLIWAFMFYGGMLVLLAQVVVCVGAVAFLYGLFKADLKSFAGRFVLAGAIGLAISLSRFLAVSAFAGNFPRNYYKIPGSGFLESVELFFRSLFLPAAWTFSPDIISHTQWNPQLHEYDFSITPLPLIMIAAGVVYRTAKRKSLAIRNMTFGSWLYAAGLAGMLILPTALNVYSPGWHEFLKTMPVIKTASTMIRWYVIYLIVLIIAAALIYEHAGVFERIRTPLAAAGIAVAVLIFAMQPTDYYTSEHYDPSDIVKSYQDHKSGDLYPQVNDVVMFADEEGRHVITSSDNDAIAMKSSQLYCYEPIFGYNLEQFPRKTLQPGSISIESGGVLNLKNPACYVYPRENNCRPGDHFTTAQKNEMTAFAAYRPYAFSVSAKQTVADRISIATLILCLFCILFYAGLRLNRKFSRQTKPSK